jgi:hypothetical protein
MEATPTRIAITVGATKSYTYALSACLRSISRNIFHYDKLHPGADFLIILVGDEHIEEYQSEVIRLMPKANVETVVHDWGEGENYKTQAQLTIAQMRSAGAEAARSWGADYLWSIDSDVLIPDNGLLCSLQMLEFDNGYYSIACCPYPSQGIGGFLCGRGTHRRHILPDFVFEEREAPEKLLEERECLMDAIESGNFRHQDLSKDLAHQRVHSIEQWVENNCPPKFGGDIWKVIASYGWKPRGWFDNAYPGIGKGSIVPTDWCGMGATLMNSEALSCVDYTGYLGQGTEDLFIVWNRWYPRNLRLCAIPHVPCDHVVRTGTEKKIVHQFTYHEQDGDAVGHLRKDVRPFLQHHKGEKLLPGNDGVPGRTLPEVVEPDYQI